MPRPIQSSPRPRQPPPRQCDRPARAPVLILVREGDAVPRAHLCRQLDREDVPTIRAAPLDGFISFVVPTGRIAGVEVREDAFGVRGAPEVAGRAKEPQPVAHDRPAQRTADIVLVEQRGRPRQADATQVFVDVVRPQGIAGAAVERGPVEAVAAGSGYEVDARPARFAFTKPPRHEDLHFVRVGHVVDEGGHAAAVERRRDGKAIDQHAPLVCAAPVRREERHERFGHRAPRGVVGRDPGNGGQQRSVAARDGKRGERFGIDDHLTPRRLRVDNGCLAGHRDGFLEGADAHLGIDRDHARPGHLHPLTLNRVEPGQT